MEVISLADSFKKYISSLVGKEKTAFEKYCLGICDDVPKQLQYSYNDYFKIIDDLKQHFNFGDYKFVIYRRGRIAKNEFPLSYKHSVRILPAPTYTLTNTEVFRGAKIKFSFANICSECYSYFIIHPEMNLQKIRLDDDFVFVLDGWGDFIEKEFAKFNIISIIFDERRTRHILYNKDDICVVDGKIFFTRHGELNKIYNSKKDIGLRTFLDYE